MKKYTFQISIMALIVSLIAIGGTLFQNWNKNWDSVMFAVAMLSALVMILIGWNIYTVFDAGKKMDLLRSYVEKQQTKTNETLNFLQMKTYMSLTDFYKKIDVIHEYFIHSLLVVEYALNGNDINVANLYIDDMNNQFPIKKPIENFYKAHVLRQLFQLKSHPLISEIKSFDLLFSRINDSLYSK